MRTYALASLVLLAACGTPRERCIHSAERELSTVAELIVEVETALNRGFREVPDARHEFTFGTCIGVNGAATICTQTVERVEMRPEAIDPQTEKRKLLNLQKRHAVLGKEAEREIAACVKEHDK
jgi:hypothetical protein